MSDFILRLFYFNVLKKLLNKILLHEQIVDIFQAQDIYILTNKTAWSFEISSMYKQEGIIGKLRNKFLDC